MESAKFRTKCFINTLVLLISLAVSAQAQVTASPNLTAPDDGAEGLPTPITFEWSSVLSANSYQLQIATNEDFDDIIFDVTTSGTRHDVDDLAYETTYFWRVRASGMFGTSSWAGPRSFTTEEDDEQAILPGTPEPVSPENGASGRPTTIAFEWEEASNADSYRLQVAEDEGFEEMTANRDGITGTTETVTELNHASTYYWRVQAVNFAGAGNWSDVRVFSTVEEDEDETTEPLPPPGAEFPENGAEDMSVELVRIEWTQTEGARTYDFQLAKDQDFNERLVDLTDVTSQYYRARDLQSGTTYWWRVRAKNTNNDLVSEWGTYHFTTEFGPVTYSVSSPVSGLIWQATDTRPIEWEMNGRPGGDDGSSGTIRISFSADDGATWSHITEEVAADQGSYDWQIPDTSSMNARIRITDTGNSEKQSISAPFVIYPARVSVSPGYSFDENPRSTDYRLAGLPAQTYIPVNRLFNGDYDEQWKVYLDNGNASDYLIPYDGTENFHFNPGNGFWVINRGSVHFEESFEPVPLSDDASYSIPVHQGWNIISNPFHISVSWDKVREYNDLNEPVWRFDGSWKQSEELKPYEGYYFYNESEIDELTIPFDTHTTRSEKISNHSEWAVPGSESDVTEYATDSSVPARTPSGTGIVEKTEDNWLSLSLHVNDRQMSDVKFGFITDQTDEREGYGHRSPPGDFPDYHLAIIEGDESDSSRCNQFAAVVRTGMDRLQEYTLQLIARQNKSIQFEINGLDHLQDYEVHLVSGETGKFHNLSDDNPVRITPAKERTTWKLFIGLPEAIQETKEQFLPESLHLAQNYPNPFNAQTIIEFSIPESVSGQHILLEIYDIQGRRITTLVDERKEAGFYRRSWDASQVASGVYIYRLRAGSRIYTRNMTIIK